MTRAGLHHYGASNDLSHRDGLFRPLVCGPREREDASAIRRKGRAVKEGAGTVILRYEIAASAIPRPFVRPLPIRRGSDRNLRTCPGLQSLCTSRDNTPRCMSGAPASQRSVLAHGTDHRRTQRPGDPERIRSATTSDPASTKYRVPRLFDLAIRLTGEKRRSDEDTRLPENDNFD